jgi:hypothetical protein
MAERKRSEGGKAAGITAVPAPLRSIAAVATHPV